MELGLIGLGKMGGNMAERGWGRVGPSGAGHFVKMIHNGIEYGLMQAYAEGFSMSVMRHEFGGHAVKNV
jgi:6-phosphogluconate dehydrogenase (decarboxylating)